MTDHRVGSPIVTPRGPVVSVRFLNRTDGDRLIDLFLKLSPGTRYSRFHATLENVAPSLLQQEVQAFINVDGVNRAALVGVIEEAGEEAIIGVARMAREPGQPDAEVAIVVRDDWQRQGIGSGLLTRLGVYARDLGIISFWAVVMSTNRAALNILGNLNVPVHTHFDHGEAHVRFFLEDIPS